MDEPAQKPRPRRRFFRFGLRTFFVFVTLVACASAWLGIRMNRYRQEEQAISHLSTAQDGRNVQILFGSAFANAEKKITGEPGTLAASFQGGPPWLTKLLGFDIFRAAVNFRCNAPGNTFTWERDDSGRLVFIYDFKTGLTDADMQWINKLSHLQFLTLEANNITDSGLAQLDNLPYLETLNLSNTSITDAGLPSLQNFPQLRDLGLRATNLSDEAIDTLGKCKQLERLTLGMTNITPDGIKLLQEKLPNCKIEQ